MKVEVVDNTEVDSTCPAGYFRVTWTDETWRAKVFHTSDPRLQRYLEAVEELKRDLGVYFPCVVDECPFKTFKDVDELNKHSREHHIEEWRDADGNTLVRYPGADRAGDFTWHVL